LGFLRAIHDAEIEPVASGAALPAASSAADRVFVNSGSEAIVLPAWGRWPAYSVAPLEHFGSDGRGFYPLIQKASTTSFYPKFFNRNIYTFSFSGSSLRAQASGGAATFSVVRDVSMRLFSNNTTATWSVIFEIGIREDDAGPEVEIEMQCSTQIGSKSITTTSSQINNIVKYMTVSGPGVVVAGGDISLGTVVTGVNVQAGIITINQTATQTGSALLKFKIPIGPNIRQIQWLPPLMEQQIHVTDLLSKNRVGVILYKQPFPTATTNEFGYACDAVQYNSLSRSPFESLPTGDNFVLRMRIGQFDTENGFSPRGFAGYTVMAPPP
jgi:hypothetical protein